VNVLLLHAFPLDERMWEPQRAALAEHDVIAPRLYGRGKTMDAWAGSLEAEIGGEVVAVGASMGGYCALALARGAPERIRALLLVGARPDADSDERRAARAETIALIRDEGPEALWRSMVPKLFADESEADPRLLFRDPDGLVEAVEAIRDRADSTGVVRTFEGQIEFVVGESDPFVSAEELAELDVREIEGARHLVNLERPDEFNAILLEFLGRV
jgi:pimeloyl-ACP methyl ester carboxylesterase